MRAEVVRHQTIMKVNCLVSGFVVTQCDRCLEDLVLKVDFEREMTVGFGAVEVEGTGAEEDVVLIDPTQSELNMNQFIYDYICLSLPIEIQDTGARFLGIFVSPCSSTDRMEVS